MRLKLRRLFIIISTLFPGAIVLSIADSEPNMKDGSWKITAKMEMLQHLSGKWVGE